ncbi:hypothetical protein HYH03_004779 [Edaphochlamys debaryana]|uniref:Uncharacterized protein n=1 Tax=Edaphochlamys debaryana TaxID=47281 RepID=A0A835Y6M8_9CHLO|nr:hypothetical protein HYH03_004779 [Edaphochlamys debaryana]|eukprot:KAG2497190.1 hypothetical protein HYH03_004779 [Edaphochlamys debaryana]
MQDPSCDLAAFERSPSGTGAAMPLMRSSDPGSFTRPSHPSDTCPSPCAPWPASMHSLEPATPDDIDDTACFWADSPFDPPSSANGPCSSSDALCPTASPPCSSPVGSFTAGCATPPGGCERRMFVSGSESHPSAPSSSDAPSTDVPSPSSTEALPSPPAASRLHRDRQALLGWCVWEDAYGNEYVSDGAGGVRPRASPDEPLPALSAKTPASVSDSGSVDGPAAAVGLLSRASSLDADLDLPLDLLDLDLEIDSAEAKAAEAKTAAAEAESEAARLRRLLPPLRPEGPFDWSLRLISPERDVELGVEPAESSAGVAKLYKVRAASRQAAHTSAGPRAAECLLLRGAREGPRPATPAKVITADALLDYAHRRFKKGMALMCKAAWTSRPVEPILPEGTAAASLGSRLPGTIVENPSGPAQIAVPEDSGVKLVSTFPSAKTGPAKPVAAGHNAAGMPPVRPPTATPTATSAAPRSVAPKALACKAAHAKRPAALSSAKSLPNPSRPAPAKRNGSAGPRQRLSFSGAERPVAEAGAAAAEERLAKRPRPSVA